jgi:hypothetical protein
VSTNVPSRSKTIVASLRRLVTARFRSKLGVHGLTIGHIGHRKARLSLPNHWIKQMTTTLVGAKVEEGDEFCIGASWLQGCFAEGWTHLDSFARSALIVEVAGEGFSTVWNGITPKGELQEPKKLCHPSNARQWRGHSLSRTAQCFREPCFARERLDNCLSSNRGKRRAGST